MSPASSRVTPRESAVGSPIAAEGATAPESLRLQGPRGHEDTLESGPVRTVPTEGVSARFLIKGRS